MVNYSKTKYYSITSDNNCFRLCSLLLENVLVILVLTRGHVGRDIPTTLVTVPILHGGAGIVAEVRSMLVLEAIHSRL